MACVGSRKVNAYSSDDLIKQNRFLADVHSGIHGDMDRAPFQTIIPTKNPSGAVTSLELPDGLKQQGHGIFQAHMHTRRVVLVVLFLGT